jgi:hypothetical protein
MTLLFVLGCCLAVSQPLLASSLGMNGESQDASTSVRKSAFKLSGLTTASAELSAVRSAPSTLQFRSALSNSSALENKASGAFSKAKEFRFYLSTQCVVDPPTPPPSVVPEPSSIVLCALGFAILTFAAGTRGKLKINLQ